MKNLGLSLLLIVAVLVSSCIDYTAQIKPFPDPFLDSFRGKGIKYILKPWTSDSTKFDTLGFDGTGNLIYKTGFMLREWLSYDSLNFITKLISYSDTYQNYSINYKTDRRVLVQTWRQMRHPKTIDAKLDTGDVFNVIKFELDDSGRIVKEVDTLAKQYAIFTYDVDNHLIEKCGYLISNRQRQCSWKFNYQGLELEKATHICDNDTMTVHHFHKGLLKSTLEKGVVFKYLYVYY